MKYVRRSDGDGYVYEAVQLDGQNAHQVAEWGGENIVQADTGIAGYYKSYKVYVFPDHVAARNPDWVVRDRTGRLTVWKDEQFRETFIGYPLVHVWRWQRAP